jgi:transposase InsO family protein
MAWKEVKPMEERVRFVFMVEDETKTFIQLCRDFGISRNTGYKWWKRFKAGGLPALEERSRRPLSSPNLTSLKWEKRILLLRRRRPHWGPKKLRSRLMATFRRDAVPACSTIGRILSSAGVVKKGRRRRPPGPIVIRPGLTEPVAPNEVWAVDYKGWFRLGNGQRCEPLTVSDLSSRYLLCCWAGADVSYESARAVFEKLFKEMGQPARIRVDNGPPFGSRGAAGLSRLAVWWVSLGITPEFIDPGHPEQNGSHERMHRTLKAEVIQPVSHYRPTQQKRFDRWRWQFNHERPHEALGLVTPASLYRQSPNIYRGPSGPVYSRHHAERRVRSNGEINWAGRKRFVGEAFVGHTLGVLPSAEGKQLVYFYDYLLGEIDESQPGGMKPSVSLRQKKQEKTVRQDGGA